MIFSGSFCTCTFVQCTSTLQLMSLFMKANFHLYDLHEYGSSIMYLSIY